MKCRDHGGRGGDGYPQCPDCLYELNEDMLPGDLEKMEATLNELIEKARNHVMTPAEKRAQAISFAYGNAKIENPHITREMVAEAYDKLVAERKQNEERG